MQKQILLLCLIFFAACETTPQSTIAAPLTQNAGNTALTKNEIDTTGLCFAPIKIMSLHSSSPPAQGLYNNDFKNLSITFKNVCSKTITSIKFKCYGKDTEGKLVDAGYFIETGPGNDLPAHKLSPKQRTTHHWLVNTAIVKKFTLIYPVAITFEDETEWALSSSKNRENDIVSY